MEIEVVQDKENPLLERREVEFRISHPNAPTPRRVEVLDALSKKLGVDPNLVVIRRISTLHGRAYSSGLAHVYRKLETLLSIEPKYLLERGKPKEEKGKQAEAKAQEEKPKK
jgi:small subunit ribosomal protein S24e